MRQTDEEIRRLWSLHGVQPRSRDESIKLMRLIEAQRRRDEARGELLHAEMLLDQARRAMDEPGRMIEPHVIADFPVPPPEPPSAAHKHKIAEILDAVRHKARAFFAWNGRR